MIFLTRPQSCGDTGRSLKSKQHPAPLLRSRFFCTPHSARRAFARRARSMGVSGIRKDPDALRCVENTPTRFQVVISLKNLGGIMPNTINRPNLGKTSRKISKALLQVKEIPELRQEHIDILVEAVAPIVQYAIKAWLEIHIGRMKADADATAGEPSQKGGAK